MGAGPTSLEFSTPRAASPQAVYGGGVPWLRPSRLIDYLANLSAGRFVLWCYFIWWAVVLVRYFDPRPAIWLTSLGVSLIIGVALLINTTSSGKTRIRLEPWPAFRLFLTPFCVSSFAALVKDRGFFLVFSPNPWELAAAAGLCAALALAALLARRARAYRTRQGG